MNIRDLVLDDNPAVFELGHQLFTPEKLPTLCRAWDEDELVLDSHPESIARREEAVETW